MLKAVLWTLFLDYSYSLNCIFYEAIKKHKHTDTKYTDQHAMSLREGVVRELG